MTDTAKDDGGAAFPGRDTESYPDNYFPGMSLRDYFAAKALHGVMSGGWAQQSATIQQIHANKRAACDALATDCYVMADAMLEARK